MTHLDRMVLINPEEIILKYLNFYNAGLNLRSGESS